MRNESSDSVRICYPEFSREELIERLKEGARKLSERLPVVCVVLFGSYAKNRQTAASDVDLLLVYGDPKNAEDYAIAWDCFDLPMLELQVFTLSQFMKQIRDNERFSREVIEHGIVIHGRIP